MTDEQKKLMREGRDKAREARKGAIGTGFGSAPVGDSPEKEEVQEANSVVGMLKNIASSLETLNKRVTKIETGGKNEFKDNAKSADIEKASAYRKGVDERIVRIVDEMLGEDFGIAVDTFDDKPGLLFTLIVPQRLSDNHISERPVRDIATGKYQMRPDGGGWVTEQYFPEDRRSRAISSVQSFDAIKEHCERVRSYIVAYYQKASKPLPPFKVTNN